MKTTPTGKHYEVEDRHWWYRGRWAVVEALLSHADLPPTPASSMPAAAPAAT